jgi:hypothetical protein
MDLEHTAPRKETTPDTDPSQVLSQPGIETGGEPFSAPLFDALDDGSGSSAATGEGQGDAVSPASAEEADDEANSSTGTPSATNWF